MFIESYFQTASHLFDQYELQMPLHLFLKEYFRNNKKFGSRDRKYIAELVYGIYRLGVSNQHLRVRDRLTLGSFLSNRLPILFFQKVNPLLASNYQLSFEEKKAFLISEFDCNFDLPFKLSEGISEDDFLRHLYSQPKVFIRIRQNKPKIEEALLKHKIEFTKVNDTCFSFDSNTKLTEILDLQDFVIQDYASQQVGAYLTPQNKERWWDCCAASGGKSIMLLDKNRNIELVATDIRDSILKNLHERMGIYGYASNYLSFTIDVTKDVSSIIKNKFDAIICDAPCSGSGTWSHSPEQFYFFSDEKLKQFELMQYDIVANAIQYLKPGGKLFYITCSLIQNENENLVDKIVAESTMKNYRSESINGSQLGGDYMYISEMHLPV
ncbi:MAG TPA: hypothetical protein PLU17_09475 [Chitinophagaceae bacterium]|nr:hypothetical protein [Chitinophagaceae bacterium]